MPTQEVKMKSIWYVVGLMLLVMGVLVLAGGVYNLVEPPARTTVLASIHPELWWGGIITVFGAILFLAHRKK